MGEHLAYEDPVGMYLAYLSRYTRCRDMSVRDAHRLLLSRIAAKEYGVTEDQLLWLDENLQEEKGMEETKTVTGVIEEVREAVCSNICKFPDRYTPDEWEQVFETVCRDCPLNRL